MSVYPDKIFDRFLAPAFSGVAVGANANGVGATLVCGCFVRISLNIDKTGKRIREARFESNGCVYMIAAADELCEFLDGKCLPELNRAEFEQDSGVFTEHRKHCRETGVVAARAALADYRSRVIEEFVGEKALICTCFGISEERLDECIRHNNLESVEDVGEHCRAGSGCGSCQFLIAEMLEAKPA